MGAASPWRHSVTELLRRHGARRALRVAAPMGDLILTSAAVPDDAELTADLVLESIAAGSLTVTGTVTVPWTGECRRCLRPVDGVAELDVSEVFTRTAVAGDTYPLEGDVVDLAPMVRDVALLALPLAPLCAPDCRGPDPDAHPVALAVEAEPDDVDGPAADRRWAPLAGLRLDD